MSLVAIRDLPPTGLAAVENRRVGAGTGGLNRSSRASRPTGIFAIGLKRSPGLKSSRSAHVPWLSVLERTVLDDWARNGARADSLDKGPPPGTAVTFGEVFAGQGSQEWDRFESRLRFVSWRLGFELSFQFCDLFLKCSSGFCFGP